MTFYQWLETYDILAIVLRLLLTSVCSGMLGYEREKRNQAAGFRTYMIVSNASALVMMTNQFINQTVGTGDPVRMGAQVISGIGFLGAGAILVTRNQQVRGLTTAAGLWASAIVGMALGSGYYTGIIAIDGCTAHSGDVNVLISEKDRNEIPGTISICHLHKRQRKEKLTFMGVAYHYLALRASFTLVAALYRRHREQHNCASAKTSPPAGRCEEVSVPMAVPSDASCLQLLYRYLLL